MKRILLFTVAFLILISSHAQMGGAQKITSKKQQALVDSLKSTPYPYVFPILGDKVRKRGIILPLPHGVMVNYLQMVQQIDISNLSVGFNGGPMYSLADIVKFKKTQGNIITPNVRLDTWLLPFLDVYGIAGYGTGTLNVQLSDPFPFETNTDLNGPYFGIGTMVTGAVGSVFIANDYNYTWTFNEKLDHPATVFMTGLRAGPIFRIRNKERMNVSVWSGVCYAQLNSGTSGNIKFSEVFPGNKLDEADAKLDNWYNTKYADAGPATKPIIKEVYDRSKEAIGKLRNGVDAGSIQYDLQKKFANPFTMLLGSQWQINDTWQLRGELQFLGDRKMIFLSVNYRFGIPGRTLFSKK